MRAWLLSRKFLSRCLTLRAGVDIFGPLPALRKAATPGVDTRLWETPESDETELEADLWPLHCSLSGSHQDILRVLHCGSEWAMQTLTAVMSQLKQISGIHSKLQQLMLHD